MAYHDDPRINDLYDPEESEKSFDEEDFEDEFEQALMECGMGPDGYCSLAGTEFCDWDCPIMNEL